MSEKIELVEVLKNLQELITKPEKELERIDVSERLYSYIQNSLEHNIRRDEQGRIIVKMAGVVIGVNRNLENLDFLPIYK